MRGLLGAWRAVAGNAAADWNGAGQRRLLSLLLLVATLASAGAAAGGVIGGSLLSRGGLKAAATCSYSVRSDAAPREREEGRTGGGEEVLPKEPAPTPGQLRCAICAQVVGRYFIEDGPYHPSCFLRMIRGEPPLVGGPNEPPLRCEVCGKRIDSDFDVDPWGLIYHSHHAREYNSCSSCGRLLVRELTGEARALEDGRNLCGLCLSLCVDGLDQLQPVLAETLAELARHKVQIPRDRIRLELVRQQNLPGRFASAQRSRGASQHIFTRGVWQHSTIMLLAPLPAPALRGVLAHELGHVWLSAQGLGDAAPQLVEGTCNLLQAWVLEAQLYRPAGGVGRKKAAAAGSAEARQREREWIEHLLRSLRLDRDPVYGAGFREARAQVEAFGWEAWIERLRRERSAANAGPGAGD
jgi:hypothetical protein